MDDILDQIKTERARQDKLWGIQDHSLDRWLAILVEEVGEFAKDILENRIEHAREELLQVAAVAVAALESMDRVNNNKI